ncbi:hypothetical protein EG329_011599 [Mollisiaceae sp. DMI_Dod_QoI]|nr:hypothetical protein EG329_011599 [Helotiales sp. DMI_Dod_QoI]
MRFQPARISVVLSFLFHLLMVSADRVFESSSLETCQTNSSFTASLFNIVFTPDNNTLSLNVVGDSSVTGNVTFKVQASVYGYTFLRETLDPCTSGLTSLCPMSQIQTGFDTTWNNISSSFINRIPGVAYGIPDLDATVTIYMYEVDNPTTSLACVRLRISNGKTVNQTGVRWGTALVAILGFAASAIVSSLGYTNSAAHMMLYVLSLFNYFQAVAMIGLCAVPLPPIVRSWTQDMSWSVGIIHVNFLQRMATWYQLATGGTPSKILTTLSTKSVQIAKRNVISSSGLIERANSLYRRAETATTQSGEYIVTGMDRIAFLEDMEATNLFFTGLTFYCIFVIFSLLFVIIFKELCELAIRAQWISTRSYLFQKIRNNWRVTLKGTIFRLILIGYPPMTILCLWEFTQNDSPAEIFLAVVFFFGMSAALALAAYNVFQTAKHSERTHKTPAYSLYADGTVLKKWGFLYTQFKASAYSYVVPILAYILIKGAFIGLGQKSGTTQAIALVMIEAFALIGATVVRPWMDKTTNGINIAICVTNFINAIFLLIFTNVFAEPGLLVGVVGVVFFIMNVVFALVLLLIVIFVVALSFIHKNPDTQYQPMADDRASFIKSQTALTTELASLGAAARGGTLSEEKDALAFHHQRSPMYPTAPYRDSSSPPITPTMHKANDDFSGSDSRHGDAYRASDTTLARLNNRSPSNISNSPGFRAGSPASNAHFSNRAQSDRISSRPQSQNSNSQWQRGAGYNERT